MADVTQTGVQESAQTETSIVTITPVALDKVRELMKERDLEGYALRVFVQGGGCSGFSYGMAFEENIYDQDKVVEFDGTRIVVDPTSLMYMHGAEIDFVDSLMGGGFAINNPNAVSSCGCGNSFRTADGEAPAGGSCSSCG